MDSLVNTGVSIIAGALDGVSDNEGVGIDKFKALPIDRGGISNIGPIFSGQVNDFFWSGYYGAFENLIWLIKEVFSFRWVQMISTPFIGVYDALDTMTASVKISIIAVGLALSATVYGLQAMRGRLSSGFINIAMTIAIAAMLSGILLNPWAKFMGPEGYFEKMRSAASETAAMMLNDGNETGEISSDEIVDNEVASAYATTLIREPAMLIAFGSTLDGECKDKFNEAMKNEIPGDTSSKKVREAVYTCDENAERHSLNAALQVDVILGSGIMLGAFMLFTLVCAALVFVSFVWFVIKLCMLGWRAIAALFPSEDRAGFWEALVDLFTSMFFITFSLVIMVVHLMATEILFTLIGSMGKYKYTMVLVFTIAMIVAVFKFRSWIIARGKNLAKKISSLSNSPGSAQGPSSTSKAATFARGLGRTAMHVGSNRSMSRSIAKGQGTSGASSKAGTSSTEPAPVAKPGAPEKGGSTRSQPVGRRISAAAGKASLAVLKKTPGVGVAATGAHAAVKGAKAIKTGVSSTKTYFAPESRAQRKTDAAKSKLASVRSKTNSQHERRHQKIDNLEARTLHAAPGSFTQRRLQSKSDRLQSRLAPSTRRTDRHENLKKRLQEAKSREQGIVTTRQRNERNLTQAAHARRAATKHQRLS